MSIERLSLTKRNWILIIGLTVISRLVVGFGFLSQMPLVKDALDYHRMAQAMLSGDEFSRPFYWPPGTALILSSGYRLFGDTEIAAQAMVILFSLFTVVGVVLLARILFRDRLVAVCAGVIAALYPPSVMLAGQSYSQHFIAAALVWMVLLWVALFWVPGSESGGADSGWARTILYSLATGAVWGFGCLIRPSVLSLAPVFVCSLFLVRRSIPFCDWRPQSSAVNGACFNGRGMTASGGLDDFTAGDPAQAGQAAGSSLRQGTAGSKGCVALLALFIGCSVIVLPVMKFNADQGAGWVVSTNNERNFFIGNNPYTPLYKTSHLAQRPLEEHPPKVQAYLRSFYDAENPREAMMAEALLHIRQHPLRFLLRAVNRFRGFWGFDYLGSREIQQWAGWGIPALLALLLLEAGGYVAVMVLVIAGLVWFVNGLETRASLFLLACVFFYQIPYCLAFSAGTYHYPAVWLLMPFAAVGLVGMVEHGLLRMLKKLPVWAWVLLVVFTLIQVEYAYFAASYF